MVFFCIPCLVLIIYFVIIAIFFPKYRPYIKEAWRCFLDKLKGKKCSISFDNKMRLAFSMWLAKHNMPKLGKFFYKQKNFNMVFTIIGSIIIIVSTILLILLVKFLIHPPCTPDSGCSLG